MTKLLEPYRVLDLTQDKGMLCGQILADMGADVIQVEPVGGANGRHLAPFLDAEPHPHNSLYWNGYSRGKRSIELDLDSQKDQFIDLVRRADVLIESETVGMMDGRGFGYADLSEINPALIYVSITPYGIDGPKAHWAASDLTLVANAGPLSLTGDEDRPPLRVSIPQAWNHAAAEAFTGVLVALIERARSSLGQHVVVSAQQALTLATQGNILSAAVGESTIARIAGGMQTGDIRIRLTYPALDGFVSITHIFGATVGPATRRLMEFVYDEGFCDEATRDKDWIAYGLHLATGEESIPEFERVKKCVAACTASKTKAQLLEVATARKLLMAPVTTLEEVANSEQFSARQFFVPAQQSTIDTPKGDRKAGMYPGAYAKFSKTPLLINTLAAGIGQHTKEVFDQLPKIPVLNLPQGKQLERPLEGVKILDFMWALAGPGATRILADFGATVIRVESSKILDVCRTIRPFINGDQLTENSAVFHTTNAGKKLISLDLANPESRDVVLDLVRWADVVTESFTPQVMKNLGLDYDSLCKINPDLIMLSTCLMGQTGPLSQFAGYGNLAAAISGFYDITGWSDREPAGPFGAYTDYIAPKFNATAVLAALDYRRRTGQGQHIDLAQAEAAMHFLTPGLLDFTANGNLQSRIGNRDINFAPHGVYPLQGEDQFIAIACETDAHWQALSAIFPSLGSKAEYQTIDDRKQHEDALDDDIRAITTDMSGTELETMLQAKGIPAALVQNSPELVEDPQLKHLGHFKPLPHHEAGGTMIESGRVHLSRAKPVIDSSAPTFARDMMYVLQDVLEYDDEKIGGLLVAGIFE